MFEVKLISLAFLAAVNIMTFVAFGLDKWNAQRNAGRIPEIALIATSAIGGAFGGLSGMAVFRHKTKNPGFVLGMVLSLTTSAMICYWLYGNVWSG